MATSIGVGSIAKAPSMRRESTRSPLDADRLAESRVRGERVRRHARAALPFSIAARSANLRSPFSTSRTR